MFLVVYSERGLVTNREPNLRLFNVLYWVTVSAFAVTGCGYYTSLYCTAVEYKDFLELIFVIGLDLLLIEYLEKRKKKYVAGQCLNQNTFSAFGGTRRKNIFSGKETRKYVFCFHSILLFDLLLEKLPVGSFSHK